MIDSGDRSGKPMFPPQAFGGGGSPFQNNGQQAPKQFSAPPSNNPSHSQLYGQKEHNVNLPDLLAAIRVWHRGKKGRGPDGSTITIPWFALEVIHLDSNTVIFTEPLEPQDIDEDIHQMIEQKIEMRYEAYRGEFPQQRFEIRCHFRSDDGEITAWEPFTCGIHLPPKMQHYGQSHQGGMSGGFFGGSGYGGPFGSGGGSSGAGLANGNNMHAVFVRANIDATQMANVVLFRALDLIENHSRRLEASNSRHEDREVQRIELMNSLMDSSAKRKLDEQMAELKMAALQTALEKTMQALPMGFAVLNRWLKSKQEEKSGKVTSRQSKAELILKNIMNQLQKNPGTSDPETVRGMLKEMVGLDEQTIDDTFALFQEFYFDQMIENSEKRVKEEILGFGEGEDSSNGLTRLLKAAGVNKDEDMK
jgi:uncharacterized membrane protein YgcG